MQYPPGPGVQAMQPYVYLDVLDTDRTALGGTREEVRQAEEYARRGEAELKMSVLCGLTPVFPQTYGWDSAALLDYGAEESFEGESFLWLLKKGFIRVCLRNQPSIWDAALAAFESPAYRRLGAWPEFNTNNPLEDRRPLVEAMRTGKRPAALTDPVWYRVDKLRELSDAAEQAPPDELELPGRDRLSKLIKVAAGAAEQVNQKVATFLWRCVTEVSDADNRTAIDTFLDAEKRQGRNVPPEVRLITNRCFNAVAAECVRAHPVLTLPLSRPVALEILLRALPRSMQSDLFESASIKPSEVPDLEVVGWRDVKLFLKECSDLSPTEKVRQAEAAKLIAKVAVKKVPRHAIKVKWSNALCNASIGGRLVPPPFSRVTPSVVSQALLLLSPLPARLASRMHLQEDWAVLTFELRWKPG